MKLQRPGPPVAVEAGGDAAREVRQRHWALGEVGRLEHAEVAALLLTAEDDAEQPAVAFDGILRARHEDRLAEAVVFAGRPARALAALEVGDVARHNPAVAVVAHAEALVEARELPGAVVELLLLEGVGLAGEIKGPAEQPRRRRLLRGRRAVGQREK